MSNIYWDGTTSKQTDANLGASGPKFRCRKITLVVAVIRKTAITKAHNLRS